MCGNEQVNCREVKEAKSRDRNDYAMSALCTISLPRLLLTDSCPKGNE